MASMSTTASAAILLPRRPTLAATPATPVALRRGRSRLRLGGSTVAKRCSRSSEFERTMSAVKLRGGISTAGAASSAAPVVSREVKTSAAFPISETFAELKKQGKVALIPYITAGDPNLETTRRAVKLLDECGADIIELGVPYSDPLADGPVIHAAATRAILRGSNLDLVLQLIAESVSDIKAPIVLFLYYNPLLKRGMERFLKEAKAAGIAGLVVPDLPLEETGKLRKLTADAGLELVLLTTPTTPTSRMTAIAEASQGFTYLVSLTGVTGARENIESRVEGLLKDLKQASDKPVAVGFGVSSPEHAAKLAEWGADGVIIGSKIVKLLGETGSPEDGLRAVEDFTRKVRDALSARCEVAPACPLVCGRE